MLTVPSSGAPRINPSMPGAWQVGFLFPISISRSKPKFQAFSEEGREERGGRRMSGSSTASGKGLTLGFGVNNSHCASEDGLSPFLQSNHFKNVCVHACTRMCVTGHLCVTGWPWKPAGAISTGACVAGRELPNAGAENRTPVLCKSTEPALQCLP